MDHTEPKWVLVGGIALAFLASAVNVDFLLNFGVSVSHLTGDVSRITADAARGATEARQELETLGAAVVGFVLGALTAGFFIHHERFDLHRPYGRSITAIGAILLSAAWIRPHSLEGALFLAAMGCGMQNGLATHYRGLILRTTHITGVVTDFGVALGMAIRGRRVERWRLAVHASLALAFAAGAAAGAAIIVYTSLPSLYVFGGCYVVGGLGWSVLKRALGVANMAS